MSHNVKRNPRVRTLGTDVQVVVSAKEVREFKSTWPGSELPERAITFRFARNGDLVEVYGARGYDGPDLAALSQDAQRFANLADVNPPDEYEYEVQGRYEGGWEMVTTEETRQGADRALREYQESERGVAFRVRRVKATPNENPPSRETRKRFGFFKAQGESAKGALALSRAEDWASAEGVEFSWEPERDVDDSWMTPEERKRPHEVYSAVARHPDGRVASLGNIFDPDSAYRRVVNAELAMELMNE